MGKVVYNVTVLEADRIDEQAQFYLMLYMYAVLVVGVIGNCMTLLIIGLNKSLQTVPNLYILNLALADIILLTVNVPVTIYEFNRDTHDYAYCEYTSPINITTILAAIYSATAVSVNRYLFLCQPAPIYRKFTTQKWLTVSIGTIWLWPIFVASPPYLFNFGIYGYHSKFNMCFFIAHHYPSYLFGTIFCCGFGVLPACILALICFQRMFAKLTQTTERIQHLSMQTNRADTLMSTDIQLLKDRVKCSTPEKDQWPTEDYKTDTKSTRTSKSFPTLEFAPRQICAGQGSQGQKRMSRFDSRLEDSRHFLAQQGGRKLSLTSSRQKRTKVAPLNPSIINEPIQEVSDWFPSGSKVILSLEESKPSAEVGAKTEVAGPASISTASGLTTALVSDLPPTLFQQNILHSTQSKSVQSHDIPKRAKKRSGKKRKQANIRRKIGQDPTMVIISELPGMVTNTNSEVSTTMQTVRNYNNNSALEKNQSSLPNNGLGIEKVSTMTQTNRSHFLQQKISDDAESKRNQLSLNMAKRKYSFKDCIYPTPLTMNVSENKPKKHQSQRFSLCPINEGNQTDEFCAACDRSSAETKMNAILARKLQGQFKIETVKQQREVIKMLFLIFIITMLSWLPMAVNFAIDPQNKTPSIVYSLSMVLAWTNSCVNIFVYVGLNSQFRKAYTQLLTGNKMPRDSNRVHISMEMSKVIASYFNPKVAKKPAFISDTSTTAMSRSTKFS